MQASLLIAQNAGEAFGWGIGAFALIAILGVLMLIVWIWAFGRCDPESSTQPE
jgi:cyanate permease